MKSKILIVDDEPIVRSVCATALRHSRFEPIITANGLEGLAAYTEQRAEICLVLCDVKMPIMDGIQLARQLFESYSHANIILMSGANLADVIPQDIEKLCAVVEKPFATSTLIEAVKKCLKYEDDKRSAAKA